jgi:hypothetical protein
MFSELGGLLEVRRIETRPYPIDLCYSMSKTWLSGKNKKVSVTPDKTVGTLANYFSGQCGLYKIFS